MSMQAVFIVFATLNTHYCNTLGIKHNVEVSSAMIAEIEQTGSTHRSVEIKRKATSILWC